MVSFDLIQIGKSDPGAQAVRSSLQAAESACPGIALELALAIINKTELNISLDEALLRLQGSTDEIEGIELSYVYGSIVSGFCSESAKRGLK
jgi:hypothetical protein